MVLIEASWGIEGVWEESLTWGWVAWLRREVSTRVEHPQFASEWGLFQLEDQMFSRMTWETLIVIHATSLRAIVQSTKQGLTRYYQISPTISEWEVQAFPVVWSTYSFVFPLTSVNLWVLIRYPRLSKRWTEHGWDTWTSEKLTWVEKWEVEWVDWSERSSSNPGNWATEQEIWTQERMRKEGIMNLAHTMRARPSLFTPNTRLTLTIWWENIVLRFVRKNGKLFEFSDEDGNYFVIPIPAATSEMVLYYRWKMSASTVKYSNTINEAEFITINYD